MLPFQAESMLRESARCGFCEEGPFDMTTLVDGPGDESIIDGYYFCGWCRKHGDPSGDGPRPKRLVEAAERKNINRVFAEDEETWTDPHKEL